jgi:hypothetical protein
MLGSLLPRRWIFGDRVNLPAGDLGSVDGRHLQLEKRACRCIRTPLTCGRTARQSYHGADDGEEPAPAHTIFLLRRIQKENATQRLAYISLLVTYRGTTY